MKGAKVKIPSISLPELKKIIKGYSHYDEIADLDQIARLIKMNRTMISANNQFLMQAGIIEGGNKKKCTEIGKKLGRALEHERTDEIKSSWQQIVQGNEFLSNLVSTVRMQKNHTMSEDDFKSHILFAADLSKKKYTMTGARAILDILLEAELLGEVDGSLEVAKPLTDAERKEKVRLSEPITMEKISEGNIERHLHNIPAININIQLTLPESEKAEVYENLFKALRKYLIESND